MNHEGLKFTREVPIMSAELRKVAPVVNIIPSGSLVSQENLVELKALSLKNFETFNWADSYAQLYLSQTPHLYVAVHRMGSFERMHKYKLDEGHLKDIHTQQEKNFRRLRVLLGIIIREVKRAGADKRVTLLCRRGILTLHENFDGKSCLPDDHLTLFNVTS
jgi:hypothetical protein